MKNIAVTGYEGNIGARLIKLGCVPLRCNVTNRAEVEDAIKYVKPDLIFHLAAMTNVDECEKNYAKAISTNTYGTSLVCAVASDWIGEEKVVLISSDQVFDGKNGLYKETDDPNPINDYGRTKFGAEGVAMVYNAKTIRISRCFDSKSSDIAGYMKQLENNESIHVPDFFYRSYCHMDYMAEAFVEYANNFFEMPSMLHLGSSFPVSLFDLMMRIADEYGYDADLITPRGEEPGHAPRPHKTGLDVSLARTSGLPIYSVNQSIERMKHEGL